MTQQSLLASDLHKETDASVELDRKTEALQKKMKECPEKRQECLKEILELSPANVSQTLEWLRRHNQGDAVAEYLAIRRKVDSNTKKDLNRKVSKQVAEYAQMLKSFGM